MYSVWRSTPWLITHLLIFLECGVNILSQIILTPWLITHILIFIECGVNILSQIILFPNWISKTVLPPIFSHQHVTRKFCSLSSFFHLSQNERICLKFLLSLHKRVKQEPHIGAIKVSHLVNFLIFNLISLGALKKRKRKKIKNK